MGRTTDMIGKVMGKVKGARQAVTGGAGIFERLASEHGEISTMIRRVAVSTTGASVRDELFPEIRRQLLAHARAEEKEVYSVFREVPELSSQMAHSADEHHEIERLVDELSAMSTHDERWGERFRTLMNTVQKHVMEEEMKIFPKAKKALTKERSEQLETVYLDAREREINRQDPSAHR